MALFVLLIETEGTEPKGGALKTAGFSYLVLEQSYKFSNCAF